MDTALEAVEDALNAVFVAIAQHRCLQRQPRGPRIGDKGLPAKTCGESSNGVCLARDAGDVVADFLKHTLLAVHRATPPAHVLGGLLDLLFPCQAEQANHPMLFELAADSSPLISLAAAGYLQ